MGHSPLYWTKLTCPCWVSRAPWEGEGWEKAGALCARSCPSPGSPPGSLGATLLNGKDGASGGPLCHIEALLLPESPPFQPGNQAPLACPHPSLGCCSIHSPPAWGLPAQGGQSCRAGTDLARRLSEARIPSRTACSCECDPQVDVTASFTFTPGGRPTLAASPPSFLRHRPRAGSHCGPPSLSFFSGFSLLFVPKISPK